MGFQEIDDIMTGIESPWKRIWNDSYSLAMQQVMTITDDGTAGEGDRRHRTVMVVYRGGGDGGVIGVDSGCGDDDTNVFLRLR